MSTKVSKEVQTPAEAALCDNAEVARLLRCSRRHVLRLAERGLMPRPIRLGNLLRWKRGAIETWIENGCPATGIVTERPEALRTKP